MKISGIMAIKNVIRGGYPFVEAILSIYPIVDGIFIADGGSDDGTYEALKRLERTFKKTKVFQIPWQKSKYWEAIDRTLETLIERAAGDWLFEVAGDNIWHEKDLPRLREKIEFAHENGFNSIRHPVRGVTWTTIDGYVYRNVRIIKKLPGLQSHWGGDDFHIGRCASPRKGFTSHDVGPELEIDIPFYHCHRLFPDNRYYADELIATEIATNDPERQRMYQYRKDLNFDCFQVPKEAGILECLPALIKGLSQQRSYKVRDELFDKDFLNRLTGLNYHDVKQENTGEEMELLKGINVVPFLRTVWVSEEARKVWQWPIAEISQFVQELEVLSVVHDHRRCSWQTIREDTLIESTRRWEQMGLVTIPVKRVGQFQGFAHYHVPVKEGEVANICVVLSKSLDDAKLYRDAHERGDNDVQGELLGFPKCCREFFDTVWKQGYYDPIWQAAVSSSRIIERNGNKVKVEAHPYSTAVLRYCGLRVGFHIPHSFDCQETIRIAEQRMSLAEEISPEKAERLKMLLKMPHSWDCYHGIAIVRTPIFYLVTSSVPCKERHVVEVEGSFIPEESVKGTIFPFNL
jgi:hypothetical protein